MQTAVEFQLNTPDLLIYSSQHKMLYAREAEHKKGKLNKSAKWHCGRHTLICKKILIKKT